MKIVIDARESGTSTGRYIDKLIEYLHKLTPDHEFIILSRQDRVSFIQSTAPTFTVMPTPYKEFSYGEQFGLKKQLNSLAADLVHFGMVQQPVFYKGTVVTTMHDLTTTRFKNPAKNVIIFSFKQAIYTWMNKKVAQKSAHIITPSRYVLEDIAQFAHIPTEKISVTYEAADFINEDPEPIKSLIGSQYIMYIGRPQPHKNLLRLVDAYEITKRQLPQLKLVLAGTTDLNYKQIANIVDERKIVDVIFTGFVSDAQLRWLYENAQAYVFPSLSEGFGLPGLEAMVHGAPVISSNATCLPEVYGDAAYYFDPLDVNSMAEAIRVVISDEKLRASLIRAGYAQAQKYSWEKMARETLAIYESKLN